MVGKSKLITLERLKFVVYLGLVLPLLAGCMTKIDLKRLIPPPTRDEDVMIFAESEALTLDWGAIKPRAPVKFFDDDSYQVGYLREESGTHYDLILANYPPEKLMGHLVQDVFKSQGIRFGEAPYRLEGELVTFLVEGHKDILCHIAMELRVVEKKTGANIWQEFYEVKKSTPSEGEILRLQEVHQDIVNQVFEEVEKQLREVDFLSKTTNEIHLRKFKRKFD